VTEEYSGFLDGRLYYETFVHHDGDVVEAAHSIRTARSTCTSTASRAG